MLFCVLPTSLWQPYTPCLLFGFSTFSGSPPLLSTEERIPRLRLSFFCFLFSCLSLSHLPLHLGTALHLQLMGTQNGWQSRFPALHHLSSHSVPTPYPSLKWGHGVLWLGTVCAQLPNFSLSSHVGEWVFLSSLSLPIFLGGRQAQSQ